MAGQEVASVKPLSDLIRGESFDQVYGCVVLDVAIWRVHFIVEGGLAAEEPERSAHKDLDVGVDLLVTRQVQLRFESLRKLARIVAIRPSSPVHIQRPHVVGVAEPVPGVAVVEQGDQGTRILANAVYFQQARIVTGFRRAGSKQPGNGQARAPATYREGFLYKLRINFVAVDWDLGDGRLSKLRTSCHNAIVVGGVGQGIGEGFGALVAHHLIE